MWRLYLTKMAFLLVTIHFQLRIFILQGHMLAKQRISVDRLLLLSPRCVLSKGLQARGTKLPWYGGAM